MAADRQALDVLSRYADRGLTVRCFDKRSAKLDNGQADGLNSRTLEIFESLGFSEKVQKEGSRMVGVRDVHLASIALWARWR